jgi:hypothetical protein
MKSLSQIILIPVFVIAFSSLVYPCTCLRISHSKEVKSTDVIFLGKVIEIVRDETYIPPKLEKVHPAIQKSVDTRKRYFVKFKVEENFKGTKAEEIILSYYEQDNFMCSGIEFMKGGKYLVYANYNKNELHDNGLCSRTQNFKNESKDYKELKSSSFKRSLKSFSN